MSDKVASYMDNYPKANKQGVFSSLEDAKLAAELIALQARWSFERDYILKVAHSADAEIRVFTKYDDGERSGTVEGRYWFGVVSQVRLTHVADAK